MKMVNDAIGILDNMFLRSEELINLAEGADSWRAGTAGSIVKADRRVTDVYDMNPEAEGLEAELHQELIDTFLAGINSYGMNFPELKISRGEGFKVVRYPEGGFYKRHIDSRDNSRIVSGVLFLNSDLKGGELVFPAQGITIQPKAGRLVLFPSNYVYAHSSEEVTEGTKYGVVSWFS